MNGKVFLPNHDNAVAVYGLFPRRHLHLRLAAREPSASISGSHPCRWRPARRRASSPPPTGITPRARPAAPRSSPRPALDGGDDRLVLAVRHLAAAHRRPTGQRADDERVPRHVEHLDDHRQRFRAAAGIVRRLPSMPMATTRCTSGRPRTRSVVPGITTTTVNLTDAANTNFGTFTRADRLRPATTCGSASPRPASRCRRRRPRRRAAHGARRSTASRSSRRHRLRHRRTSAFTRIRTRGP